MGKIGCDWHLIQTENETRITEFELHFWRAFNGFTQWIEQCEKMANGSKLDAFDLSVLHTIRIKNDSAKTISDIRNLLNRNDNFNLQYTIKKLLKMGLLEKVEASPGYDKSSLYRITAAGVQNTNRYSEARRKILIDMFIKNLDLTLVDMTKAIAKLKTIYDEAAQIAALNHFTEGTFEKT